MLHFSFTHFCKILGISWFTGFFAPARPAHPWFKDLKYYNGCLLVMTKTKTQFYALLGLNVFQEWIYSGGGYFRGLMFFRGEYFSGLNVFQMWIFLGVNSFFRGWIFVRGEYFSGVKIFHGWIFFGGKYFSGMNIFRG